jgi:cytochrome c553
LLNRYCENRTTMRIPTWLIVAFSVAFPVASMAAEGNPAAGKAKAEAAGCFACHGVDGLATEDGLATDKNLPNLDAEPDLYLQFQLVFFRTGVRKNEVMNAMAEQLSNDDLRNLSAYFASLPAPNLPAPPDTAPEETELGGKLAQAIRCTNCHGDHLEGVDNIARLAGQREDTVYKALRDFKSGARTATGAAGMAEVVYPLGDTEMKALAHYVSRLH